MEPWTRISFRESPPPSEVGIESRLARGETENDGRILVQRINPNDDDERGGIQQGEAYHAQTVLITFNHGLTVNAWLRQKAGPTPMALRGRRKVPHKT